MNICIVIPAYNEAQKIGAVLSRLADLPYRVVVVDDASTDNTVDIAQKFSVDLLRHKVNRNQGAALQTGNAYALSQGADIIVHFDADGQFLTEEIKDVVRPIIEENYDIVFGSRFLGKKSQLPRFKEFVIFPLARIFNRLFLKVNLTDPQSGFRAMTSAAARQIIIEQDGNAHCSEIMAKAISYKLKIKEVPITVLYHEFGQGLSGGWKIIKDLLLSKLSK